MMRASLVVTCIAICGWTLSASTSVVADLGQAGGVCLASWAPCVALHQAYGEYLFQGTTPAAPSGLETALRDTRAAVTSLLLLLVEQPDPPADPIVASTDLLQQLEHTPYEEVLLELAAQVGADSDTRLAGLERAADDGLFVMILDVKKRLDGLVELLLQDLDEIDRFLFSAAFIAEGLIAAPEAPDIDPSWIDALVFLEDAPPGVLSATAVDAISALVAVAESPGQLTSEDWRRIRDQATQLKTSVNETSDEVINVVLPLEQRQRREPGEETGSDPSRASESATASEGSVAAIIALVGLVIALVGIVLVATPSR